MGQFNNGYRRPDFSGSKDFYSPSNSSLAPMPAVKQKKNLKPLIIIAVIIILAVSLIIIAIPKKTQENNNDTVLTPYINQYINTILFGQDNNENDNISNIEYYRNDVYYIEEVIDDDSFEELLDKSNTYLETILNQGIVNDYLYITLKTSQDEIAFVRQYYKTNYPTPEITIDSFIQNGKEAEVNRIRSHYADLLKSDSDIAYNYAEQCVEYYTLYLDMIEIAINNQCIGNDGIFNEQKCGDIESIDDISQEMATYEINSRKYALNLIENLIKQCWDMQKAVINE